MERGDGGPRGSELASLSTIGQGRTGGAKEDRRGERGEAEDAGGRGRGGWVGRGG